MSCSFQDAGPQSLRGPDRVHHQDILLKPVEILCSSSGGLQKRTNAPPQLDTRAVQICLDFGEGKPRYVSDLFIAALLIHLQDKNKPAVLIQHVKRIMNSGIQFFSEKLLRRRDLIAVFALAV
jgi:hypothetical protein